MNRKCLVLVFLLAAAGAAQAQYKYVGPNGEVTYSDIPPPPSARDVQVKNFATGIATAGLPYDLGQAVSNFPVTLYTGEGCSLCDQARGYLKSRGVPYAEKTVTSPEDLAVLKKASGDPKSSNLPFLTVGSQKLNGFTEGSLGSLLDGQPALAPARGQCPPGFQVLAEGPQPAPRPRRHGPVRRGSRALLISATRRGAPGGSAPLRWPRFS